MSLSDELERLRADAADRLAAAESAGAIEALRHDLLGRSGELTALMKQLGSVAAADRPALGRLANDVRAEVERAIGERLQQARGTAVEAPPPPEAVGIRPAGGPGAVRH